MSGDTLKSELSHTPTCWLVLDSTRQVSAAHSQDDLDVNTRVLVLRHPGAVRHPTKVKFAHELSHAINDFIRPKGYRITRATLPLHVINHLFVFASRKMLPVHAPGRAAPGADYAHVLGGRSGAAGGQDEDGTSSSKSRSQAGPPNGSRLSCGALKKDSFHNLRAPSASSAC